MKKVLLILIAFYMTGLYARTLKVDQGGTEQYTSINQAIFSSENGDTVLVYPGRYFENNSLEHKSITIGSLYLTTHNPSYIGQTIIDANHNGGCFRIIYGETVRIVGFEMVNGSGFNSGGNTFLKAGGGVQVLFDSHLILENCRIYNCNTVGHSAISVFQSTAELKGNSVFNNRSLFGGAVGNYRGTIYYDPTNLNSIYNNYSSDGQDIAFSEAIDIPPIYLDTLSVVMTEPDFHFISIKDWESRNPVSVSVLHSAIQTRPYDLYIAPDGDDSNDGASFASPLKNLAYATHLIEADSLHPRTIYMAEGYYSRSVNQMFFPVALKDYVSLVGASPETTIIDMENQQANFVCNVRNKNNTIKNFTILNGLNYHNGALVHAYRCENLTVKNMVFKHSYGDAPSGFMIYQSKNFLLEDILIKDCHTIEGVTAGIDIFGNHEFAQGWLNNIVMDSLTSIGYFGGLSSYEIKDVNISMNNIIISNNRSSTAGVMQYGNTNFDNQVGLNFSNGLIIHNYCPIGDFGDGVILLGNQFSNPEFLNLNNLTVANNYGGQRGIYVWGKSRMRNMILYNPSLMYEIKVVWNPNSPEIITNLDIDYSLIENGRDAFLMNSHVELVYGEHNITDYPMFEGVNNTALTPAHVDYYRLAEGSPCINSGTPDISGLNIYPEDLAGNYRVWDGRIDMGCFEYGSPQENHDVIVKPKENIKVYPNPVFLNGKAKGGAPYAMFEFQHSGKIKKEAVIEIYNIKGQKIKTLSTTTNVNQLAKKAGLKMPDIDAKFNAETYSVMWNLHNDSGSAVGSGIYLFRLQIDGKPINAGKITVIK